MRKLLLLIGLVSCVIVNAQLDITKRNITVTQNFHVRSDTVLNAGEVRQLVSDSVQASITDTTSLSNRIDQRIKYSDTTNLVPGEQQFLDSLQNHRTSINTKLASSTAPSIYVPYNNPYKAVRMNGKALDSVYFQNNADTLRKFRFSMDKLGHTPAVIGVTHDATIDSITTSTKTAGSGVLLGNGSNILFTPTLAATNGGTGTGTVTTGDLLYGSATNTWSKLAAGSTVGGLLLSGGASTAPGWSASISYVAPALINNSTTPTFNAKTTGTSSYGGIIFAEGNTNVGFIQYLGSTYSTTPYRNNIRINNVQNAPIEFWTNNIARCRIQGDGSFELYGTLPFRIGGTGTGTDYVGQYGNDGTSCFFQPRVDGIAAWQLRNSVGTPYFTGNSSSLGITATKASFGTTSLKYNALYSGGSVAFLKDSIPITTGKTWGLIIDTTNNLIKRQQLLSTANVSSIVHDSLINAGNLIAKSIDINSKGGIDTAGNPYGGIVVTTSQFDKTNDSALADIPGLKKYLTAGKTYKFVTNIYLADVGFASKITIHYTGTRNYIIWSDYSLNNGNVTTTDDWYSTGSLVGPFIFAGTIKATTSGWFSVRFAQFTPNAGFTNSVLVGSTLEIKLIQ